MSVGLFSAAPNLVEKMKSPSAQLYVAHWCHSVGANHEHSSNISPKEDVKISGETEQEVTSILWKGKMFLLMDRLNLKITLVFSFENAGFNCRRPLTDNCLHDRIGFAKTQYIIPGQDNACKFSKGKRKILSLYLGQNHHFIKYRCVRKDLSAQPTFWEPVIHSPRKTGLQGTVVGKVVCVFQPVAR